MPVGLDPIPAKLVLRISVPFESNWRIVGGLDWESTYKVPSVLAFRSTGLTTFSVVRVLGVAWTKTRVRFWDGSPFQPPMLEKLPKVVRIVTTGKYSPASYV